VQKFIKNKIERYEADFDLAKDSVAFRSSFLKLAKKYKLT